MSNELLDSLDEVVEAPKDEAEAPLVETEAKAPEVEAKKEEPKVEAPKTEAPKQEPRTIPLAAHLEERRKLEAKLEQQEQARRALEERLAKLENPPKAPEPDPDYQENPKAYVDAKVQRALEALEKTKAEAGQNVQKVQKTAEEAASEARYNRFMQELQSTEATFVQQTPDYYDALGHLRSLRVQEIKLFKPDITEDELNRAIVQEEMTFANQMLAQGKNPHQFAYAIAQARGYRKAEPKEKLELPKVEGGPKQLPPDQTLGSGAAPAGDGDEKSTDEFDDAFGELFGKRKRA